MTVQAQAAALRPPLMTIVVVIIIITDIITMDAASLVPLSPLPSRLLWLTIPLPPLMSIATVTITNLVTLLRAHPLRPAILLLTHHLIDTTMTANHAIVNAPIALILAHVVNTWFQSALLVWSRLQSLFQDNVAVCSQSPPATQFALPPLSAPAFLVLSTNIAITDATLSQLILILQSLFFLSSKFRDAFQSSCLLAVSLLRLQLVHARLNPLLL